MVQGQMLGHQIGHEGDVQCSLYYFFPLFLAVLMLNGSVLFRGKGNPMIYRCFTALTFFSFWFSAASGTAVLTYMHLCMGMMATELSLRWARAPQVAISTRMELFVVCCTIAINAAVVLSETIFVHCQGVNMLTCRPRPLDPLSSRSFPSRPLYKKQHAVLHSALVFLMVSVGSSYWPRLRKSPKVQLVRMFIDPSCLCAVAHVLATHDHGAMNHELDSHPMLALMMFAASVCQFFSCTMQLAVAPGTDLTVKLDNADGGPRSALVVPRLISAFSLLILSNFLYVDTFMEYLGCRTVLIKPGGDDNPSRTGWSPTTELSTYLSITTMLAVGMLTAMVLINPDVTGLSEYATISTGEAATIITLIEKEDH